MVEELLANLSAAVDGMKQIDVDSLTDSENELVMYGCARARVELLIVGAQTTRRWEHSRRWAADGSKSPAARFARETNCSLKEARQGLRFGRALECMPHTAAALAAAEISAAHVELLSSRTRRGGSPALSANAVPPPSSRWRSGPTPAPRPANDPSRS